MMAGSDAVIDVLYYVLPIVTGAILSLVGIQKKFFTTRKYVFVLWQVWAYVFLSSVGALLVTVALRYVGTEVIGHSLLNCVLLSLLGSGLFLGLISKIPISGLANNEAGEELKTIRDFVYDFLDISIEQKIRQLVQSQLKNFSSGRTYKEGIYIPSSEDDEFLREAKRLIRGMKLSSDELGKYSADFDEFVQQGDYVSVVQVLVEHYDLDYLVGELSSFIKVSSPSELEDSRKAISFRRFLGFRFLRSSFQWIFGFIFWLGVGLLVVGILHKISPLLMNSIVLNYFRLEWAIAFGLGLLVIGILVLLIFQENK